MSEPTLLTSSEQAQMLLEQINRDILGALLNKPSSASELALETERPPKTVLYRLEKLRQVGLIEVVEKRKRGGRAVKIYASCSSGGWEFPFTLTPAATVKELLEGQILPLIGEMVGHLATQIREEMWLSFSLDDKGRVSFNLNSRGGIARNEESPKNTGTIRGLTLTLEQAQEVNRKLRDFALELEDFPEDSSLPTYYLGLFFVPKTSV
ncbi:MAG: winged helix-turn-helix transcriptional regulator [Pseudopedobacter sp.]|nr:winged helix-turn-helix transcriptional regulator [Deinococcales bacterium]